MPHAETPQAALPEAARRTLCLDLLAAAGAVSVRVNDATGEIVHGCLLSPRYGHKDQVSHPTASLNYRNLAGSCFGCNAGGGLVWFAATVLGTDEAGARAWLADGTGIEDGGVMPLAMMMAVINDAFARAAAPNAPRFPCYSPSTLEPYDRPHSYWTADPGPDGTAGRGVRPDTVARYRLGYDEGTKRVVIPHFWRGDLVGWQTRPAGPVPEDTPKYKNTPSFPKRETLFDLNPDAEEIVLVESVMSVLRHGHAMGDVSSTFGAHVAEAQVGQVVRSRRLRRALLWYDNDEAGWDAVDGGRTRREGLIERLGRHLPVFVVDSPFAGGPDDLDTATAAAVRERFAVPAVLWKRPRTLLCPRCQEFTHQGPCPTVPERG